MFRDESKSQYKSLNCARAQITDMNTLIKNLEHRIHKWEKLQEEEMIFSERSLMNSMIDVDIEHPLNSTQLDIYLYN